MNSTLQQNMASPSTFPTSPIRTLGELIADEKFDGQEMNFDITISTSQEISMVRQSNRRQSSINSNDKEVRVGGVFLTWQDLWVTVSTGKKGSHPILQGLTGYAQPGEVLAIMGPSGCEKSTLLDTLAGRLNTSTRQSGEIQVNGRKQRLSYGTSAYVTQDDTLLTTLMLGPSA